MLIQKVAIMMFVKLVVMLLKLHVNSFPVIDFQHLFIPVFDCIVMKATKRVRGCFSFDSYLNKF